ncbi:hypothetical protein ACNT2N_14305 [Pseudomonas thivervalensis]|uniref:Uncharacterized protein n=1 Tax=Pseudomonas thivervalensis TaxID=86265 RepID=A0A2Z4ZA32_9PSED|nr:hypothetical protein [Pseudomonas thivervalensis]AXA54720.1 hypothetical protein CE140_10250 [Pseudomonas thivervalensis]AXA60400.1 hypothetical protein CEQ51_10090 [Pseudomonas thivervalensis]
MLSILHPSVMRKVHELSIGLLPITIKGDSIPKLIVKTSKEAILTAKVRQGFLIYLIPYEIPGVRSLAFLAAFFDDERHPYTSGGALIKELRAKEFSLLFQAPIVDVHFFDELGREMLAYRTTFHSTKRHKDMLRGAIVPSIEGLNQSLILDRITEWFRFSSQADDASAIKVTFTESLMPDDIIYFDMRPDAHDYHGSPGFSSAPLERSEPGPFQEKEIVALLQRTFKSKEIYLAPLRVNDKEEVVDVLVVTARSVILIQAKDNQNLESTLNKTIEKKRNATKKSLKGGLGQVKGAIGYLKRTVPFVFLIDGKEIEVDLTGKRIYALLILRELFDDDYDEYTPPMLELYKATGVACIPLSYTELHQYTRFIEGDEHFYDAFNKVFSHGLETGMFPRLRVHPPGTKL